jgi:hypothetical protein
LYNISLLKAYQYSEIQDYYCGECKENFHLGYVTMQSGGYFAIFQRNVPPERWSVFMAIHDATSQKPVILNFMKVYV